MIIGFPPECPAETRSFLTAVSRSAYQDLGFEMVSDASAWSCADIVVSITPPSLNNIASMKQGSIYIGLFNPFDHAALLSAFACQSVSAISLPMIPRSTIAQPMDVLSSQASLSGYVAVTMAMGRLPKILPLMTTPSGTIQPATVFIIGVGVAGLQAIATAKRLGARVEAFDTRPVVEEQVRSLGGRFIKVDLGDTSETTDGYAHALSADQLGKQRQLMTRHCASADIVITTAQLFGKSAPRLVTDDMVSQMKPGSVIVDMAVSSGGNVEGSVLNECVTRHEVVIMGYDMLSRRVATDASQMLASNALHFIKYFYNSEEVFAFPVEDEIMDRVLLVHQGSIRWKES